VHARAGAALALLRLGDRASARDVAQAELAEAKGFGAPRALGIALRTAGLAEGGEAGLALLASSVAALRASPARLEQAHVNRRPILTPVLPHLQMLPDRKARERCLSV
jgi:hypothetical protein